MLYAGLYAKINLCQWSALQRLSARMYSTSLGLHYYDRPPYFVASPGKLGPRYRPSTHHNQEADCAGLGRDCIKTSL